MLLSITRVIFALVLLMSCLSGNGQLSKITGRITIHNSKTSTGQIRAVTGAIVSDLSNHANDDDTDEDGFFTLEFLKLSDGMKVHLAVHLEGFEVVNQTLLETNTGRKDTLFITVAKPSELARIRDDYFKVGFYASTQKQQKEIQKLNRENDSLRRAGKEFSEEAITVRKQLIKLENYVKRQEALAGLAADQMYMIDADNAGQLVKQGLDLFKQGELDAAIEIFERSDLPLRKKAFLVKEQALTRERRELVDAFMLQAQFYLIKNRIKESFSSLDEMLELDSTNARSHAVKGDYYFQIADQQNALEEYEKGLAFVKDSLTRLSISLNIAVIYMERGDLGMADITLNICRGLWEKNTDTSSPKFRRIAGAFHAILGQSIAARGQFVRADSLFQQADHFFKQLKPQQTFEYDMMMMGYLVGYGFIKSELKDIKAAQHYYFMALNKAESSKFKYDADVLNFKARIYNNLANSYLKLDNYTKAEYYYSRSESIHKANYLINDRRYGDGYSDVLNNIGLMFYQKRKYNLSERKLQEALKVIDPLVNDQFLELIENRFRIYYNLAKLYRTTKRYAESEAYYLKGREDLKVVAPRNYNYYQRFQINYLREMKDLYRLLKKPERVKYYEEQAAGLEMALEVLKFMHQQEQQRNDSTTND